MPLSKGAIRSRNKHRMTADNSGIRDGTSFITDDDKSYQALHVRFLRDLWINRIDMRSNNRLGIAEVCPPAPILPAS